MEGLGALEEFGMCQQQLCTAIPGAKMVQVVEPYQEEVTTEDGATVTYVRFTDGIVKRQDQYGVLRTYNETTIIRKTIVKNGLTTRLHTIAYWENRKTAEYVPICRPLNAAGFRMESRLFE